METTEEFYNIGIPIGTRLQALVRSRRGGRSGWLAWIGIAGNKLRAPTRWHGTFLFLCDDGSVERVTVYEDGHEDVLDIKGPDASEKR